MNPLSIVKKGSVAGGKGGMKLSDPYKWNLDDVSAFLDSLDMGTYKKNFRTQEINGESLMDLNEADMLALKLTSPSERAKLIMAISQLKAKWGRQQDGVPEDESSGTSNSGPSSSSTSNKSVTELTFKCIYGEETRIIRTHPTIAWEKLYKKIRSAFGHRMDVKYTDKAGDVISVKSEEEFKFMLTEFKDLPAVRLQLTRKRHSENTVDSGETAILETMINPVIIISSTGIVQFVNSATSRTFGYSKSELQGQNIKMLMPSSIADRHDAYLSEYLRTGVGNIIGKGRVVEGRRKDGSMITLDLAVSHTRSRKRDVFTGTFSEVQRPVTGSTSVTASPSPNAGLTAGFALLENLLFSAIVADHKGQIMFANTHAARLFGYEKSQLVGKNVRVLMPNPDSANHDNYLKNYVETRVAKVIGRARDVVGMMKDGSLIPLNLTISEQVMGNQSLFTAILRPLSDDAPRSDTKSVMQAEREMLSTLAVAAVMIDERGCIQGFNEASENLWGFKLSEVVGRNVKMLMPNPERDRHDGYLKRYLETGKQRVFGMGRDVTGVHKDGTILPVRLSVSEKKDGDKRIWTAIVQKLN